VAYPPIANHGVIGNLRTAALVCTDGTIDWFCFPHFDSPSVFAALLDDRKGGAFRIAPAATETTVKQLYWPDTNVLLTRFLTPNGVGELTDFMPIGVATEDLGGQVLVRRVRVARGRVHFRADCQPAFDYARTQHRVDLAPGRAVFSTEALTLALVTAVPLERTEGDGVTGRFVLEEGQSAVFVFGQYLPGVSCPASIERRAEELFQSTVQYWRRWLRKSTYSGRWREIVHRSALVLKLLTFEPSGAIIAAPTCSLPEVVGGTRNWDYRYSWVRDAAFTVYGLIRVGFTEEAQGFMRWLSGCVRDADEPIQAVYGIDGRRELDEVELTHLDGYRGSRPVRTGNAAYRQLQLDVYGELMDAVYLWNKYGTPVFYDTWIRLRRGMEWLSRNWRNPDEGIWEVRGGARHFTYSKMMCWVAFDRALRLADKRSFPVDRGQWSALRDEMYEEIMQKAWDGERGTFVQAYGSRALDAATLIMPLVFFVSPSDPRMIGTLKVIHRTPREGGLVSDGLVYRYNTHSHVDGIAGGADRPRRERSEGTFNLCTFWLVEALTRAGRSYPAMLEEARLTFERMMGYANHLGLYSEEIGPNGEALGNFPQAFTHLALISAAYNLDRALK
jgi:GH15 family glucan-1,4-alpha-glucosidase